MNKKEKINNLKESIKNYFSYMFEINLFDRSDDEEKLKERIKKYNYDSFLDFSDIKGSLILDFEIDDLDQETQENAYFEAIDNLLSTIN